MIISSLSHSPGLSFPMSLAATSAPFIVEITPCRLKIWVTSDSSSESSLTLNFLLFALFLTPSSSASIAACRSLASVYSLSLSCESCSSTSIDLTVARTCCIRRSEGRCRIRGGSISANFSTGERVCERTGLGCSELRQLCSILCKACRIVAGEVQTDASDRHRPLRRICST